MAGNTPNTPNTPRASATIRDGIIAYVHPDHLDGGLHAPDAVGLAARGIATASAIPVEAGAKVAAGTAADLGDAVTQ